MIQILEEKHNDQIHPKIKTYVYRCHHCGSTIQFDNNDIIEEIDWIDEEHYVWCPVCHHSIDIWWISKWRHRKGIYDLFHRKRNK